MQKYLPEKDASIRGTQTRFLDIAIGYIHTELDLLHRWTGALVELVELIYGLQELSCINNGETAVNELGSFFGRIFGLEIKDSHCYNAYPDMKRRKSENRTYYLDKMRDKLNRRMLRDNEKEMQNR